MTVSEYISLINKQRDINQDNILELKQYYLSMYRYYCLLLYDKNFISDPTKFDVKSIRQNFMDLNIKGMTSKAGGLKLNSQQIKYCLYINKEETQQEYLKLLYEMLRYREYSTALDTFYEVYGLHKVKLGIKLTRGYAGVRNGVPLNKAIARVFCESNTTVKKYSIAPFIRVAILTELGLDFDAGQIDDRLSLEDEEELVEVLFGEMPPSCLNGKKANVLYNWYNKNFGKVKSILSDVVYKNYYECLEKMNNLCEEIESKGERVVLIEGINIYAESKRNVENYPIGYFTIVGGYYDDEVFEQIEKNGYTGEGYTEEYLKEEGYNHVGLPVQITDEQNNKIFIYDVEQTSITFSSYFSDSDIDFEFDSGDVIENVLTEEDAINNSLKGVLGRIYNKGDNKNGISD